ncbi:MAG: hypothetical protein ACXWJB_06670 [Limisphaerales bacterium]
METEPQTIDSPVETAAAPANARRNGNVARLPKSLRDKINSMLDDGATYADIIAELQKATNPPLPHPISINNISNWKDGGYQDYLRNQRWQEQFHNRQEKFLDAVENEPVKLAQAAVQMAATGICEHLDELSGPQSGGETDPDKYSRITNSLSRLVRSMTVLEDYHAKLEKSKTPKSAQGLTKEQITEIQEAMRML